MTFSKRLRQFAQLVSYRSNALPGFNIALPTPEHAVDGKLGRFRGFMLVGSRRGHKNGDRRVRHRSKFADGISGLARLAVGDTVGKFRNQVRSLPGSQPGDEQEAGYHDDRQRQQGNTTTLRLRKHAGAPTADLGG